MPKEHPSINRIWTREKWREKRDEKGGKKNLVRRVSIGKLLDKFHEAAPKGIEEGEPAAKDLIKGIEKYCKKIKKKYKTLHDYIDAQLLYNVNGYYNDCLKILNSVKLYPEVLKEVEEVMEDAFQEWSAWNNGDKSQDYHSQYSKKAKNAFGNFYNVVGKLQFYSDEVDVTWAKRVEGAYRGVDGSGLTRGNVKPLYDVVEDAPKRI